MLEDIDARYLDDAQMRGVTGDTVQVAQFSIAVYLGTRIFRGIRVIGHETIDEPIVGRSLLNRMRVTLDGPAEVADFA